MSHFSVAVFTNGEATVEELLAPYDENLEVEENQDENGEVYAYNPKAKWDWYEVGGRWMGMLIPKKVLMAANMVLLAHLETTTITKVDATPFLSRKLILRKWKSANVKNSFRSMNAMSVRSIRKNTSTVSILMKKRTSR